MSELKLYSPVLVILIGAVILAIIPGVVVTLAVLAALAWSISIHVHESHRLTRRGRHDPRR